MNILILTSIILQWICIILLFFIINKIANRIANSVSNPPLREKIPTTKDDIILQNHVENYKYSLILLVNPTCEYCKSIVGNIGVVKNVNIKIISNDLRVEFNEEYTDLIRDKNIKLISSVEMFEKLNLQFIPYVLLIDKENNVLKEQTVNDIKEVLNVVSGIK